MIEPKGWHSRGYLPHFDSPEIVQFVTFGLADSLPKATALQHREDAVRSRLVRPMRSLPGQAGFGVPTTSIGSCATKSILFQTIEYVEQNPEGQVGYGRRGLGLEFGSISERLTHERAGGLRSGKIYPTSNSHQTGT